MNENKLIFINRKIKSVLQVIDEIGDMNVLIEGETGVGKTPIAEYANTVLSNDGDRPFIRVNCAGFTRERMQDELFGHKKGAFTGADCDKKGLVELAEGGDLFLDEIGDLVFDCQAELLMLLDSGEYRRLGDPAIRQSNCRIISATNRDLKSRVDEGYFRRDLYSRLAQHKVYIPPLRERKDDILPIMQYFIEKFCGQSKEYSPEVFEAFMKADWGEGNVRELRDAVRYMCRKARDSITIEMHHTNIGSHNHHLCNVDPIYGKPSVSSLKEIVLRIGFNEYLLSVEKNILKEIVVGEKSIRSLAKKLDLVDVTLYRKLKKYGIRMVES